MIPNWNDDPKWLDVSNSGKEQRFRSFDWSIFHVVKLQIPLRELQGTKISFFFSKTIMNYSDREWVSYGEPIYEF